MKNIKLRRKDYATLTLLGILFICVSMVLLQVAVKVADSPALIAIIFSSNSVFTIIVSLVLVVGRLFLTSKKPKERIE